MRLTRLVIVAVAIVASGLVLQVARAQQAAGTRRIDLQRHDLSVPGREVVQTIVEIDPGVTSSRHTHPGEEFVYVVAGEAIHVEDGSPDVVLKSGEGFVIRKGKAHSPRGGANGARAVVFRVHPTGEAERTLIE